MSSLSNLPYGKILDYWFERLKGQKNRYKFIATKVVEIYAFTKRKVNVTRTSNNLPTNRFIRNKKNEITENPKVVTIIPAFVKTDFDLNSLNRLIRQLKTNERIAEIILIDDCSPKKFKVPKYVTITRQKTNGGPAKARNKGIEIALKNEADIITFTDIDCVPDSNWIISIIKKYKTDKNVDIISGNTKSFNQNWFGKYHEMNGTLNGRKFKDSDFLLYGTTSNFAITRQVAEKLRFNENFPLAAGEDIEFCYNAIKQGFGIKHCNKAIIYHDYGYNGNVIKNTKKFMKQFEKYAEGEKTLLEFAPDYYEYFNETIEIQAN